MKDVFDHSIQPHRLPILLDALFWYHCQRYFPQSMDSTDFAKMAYYASKELGAYPESTNLYKAAYEQYIEFPSPQPLSPPYDYRNEPKETDE